MCTFTFIQLHSNNVFHITLDLKLFSPAVPWYSYNLALYLPYISTILSSTLTRRITWMILAVLILNSLRLRLNRFAHKLGKINDRKAQYLQHIYLRERRVSFWDEMLREVNILKFRRRKKNEGRKRPHMIPLTPVDFLYASHHLTAVPSWEITTWEI